MAKSAQPIDERLKRYFRRLSNDICADYEDAVLSGTPEAVASYREDFVREVVGRFFPRTYRMAKGAIFDSYGRRSASIDCVVCAPNHPLFIDATGRLVTLLSDGVHCAIEIKPDLRDMPEDFGESNSRTPEIVRGLQQVRTVKQLIRRRDDGLWSNKSEGFRDYRLRIPAHIMSFEPVDLERLGNYIARYYREKSVPLEEQVDRVVVLNIGRLVIPKFPEQGFSSPRGNLIVYPTGEDSLGVFILEATSDECYRSRWLMARALAFSMALTGSSGRRAFS